MAITTKQIQSFKLSASLSSDSCGIEFTYTDGSTHPINGIPAPRFTALAAVLQATRDVYMHYDDVLKSSWVSGSADAPGA